MRFVVALCSLGLMAMAVSASVEAKGYGGLVASGISVVVGYGSGYPHSYYPSGYPRRHHYFLSPTVRSKSALIVTGFTKGYG